MPVNSFESYYMSWVPEKPTDHTPMYISFAKQLEEAILSFSLTPNTLLPPQRELADYLDVNLSTITKAYKICEEKGYIYAITGKGTFVSPNALLYKNTVSAPEKHINLKTVEPFHNSDALVADALRKITERPGFTKLLTYQKSDLPDYHKLVAAKYLQKLHMPASSENIMIANGSQNALTIAMLSLFHAGDKIAVDAFTYHHFKMLANFLRIQLYAIENDALGMLPDRLDFACKRQNIQGIYLMPSCHNPTAVEMPEKRRRELAATISRHRLLILEDDSYRFLADIRHPTFYELLPNQTLYIHSTTKAISPGVRLAYVVYPHKLQKPLIHGECAANLHYSCLDTEIISELITSGDYIKAQLFKKEEAKKRNTLYNSIMNIQEPTANPYSFYRWLNIGNCNRPLINTLNQHGISVMESQIFNAGTDHADHFVRIALSSEQEAHTLENALKTLWKIYSSPSRSLTNSSTKC